MMETTNKNTFLFVVCDDEDIKKTKTLIAILKAFIYSKFSHEMEYFGEQAVVFSTKYSAELIRKKVNRYKVPYILIDIGASYDLEKINAVLPSAQLELLKKISKNKFSESKPVLESMREQAAEEENYERAAILRDLIKKK